MHILIPTDGSKLSAGAAAAGVKLAKSLGAKVTGFFAPPPATPLEFKGLLPAYIDHGIVSANASGGFLTMVKAPIFQWQSQSHPEVQGRLSA